MNIDDIIDVGDTLPAPRRFGLDDRGNAERLAYYFGGELRYVTLSQAWYLWDGRRWYRDQSNACRLRAMRLSDRILAELPLFIDGLDDPEDRESVTKAVKAWAKRSRGKTAMMAALDLCGCLEPIAASASDFDADPWVLNCWNGMLDLRTGNVGPHDRDKMCSKVVGVDYEPDAVCPEWERFLRWTMVDRSGLTDFLRRFFGYALTGLTSEQVMAICHGHGANGKSTLFGVIRSVLGEYATLAAPKLLEDTGREDHAANVADLDGARFVEVSENDRGKPMREALVKQLTGDDTIKARFMARNWFDFKPQFTLIYGCNHAPVIRSTDHGIWRRLMFVPFDATISEEAKDADLKAKLLGEAPGILAWLVRGCMEWQAVGLQVPDVVKRNTDDIRDDQDVIQQFLDEWVVYEETASEPTRNLYHRYSEWAKSNGYGVLNISNFGTALTDKGFEKRKRGGNIIRIGLRLKIWEAQYEAS